jgi:predicted nucleotidyltransferase
METPRIDVPMDRIREFCLKWKVKELSLFGSVLRDDFRPDSDVDVLVVLAEDAPWDLFDWVDMIEELKALFGRRVDLVEKTAITNPFRRHYILRSRKVIYAA